jgi:hypothetical protein
MRFLDRVLQPFRAISKPIQAATHDTARTHRTNAEHWQIPIQTADASPEQRTVLRNRSRYETANNSILEGMVETYARDLVGTGPHPTFAEFAGQQTRLKKEFKQWFEMSGLGPMFHTAARGYLIDGECFVLWTVEAPYFRIIEPERIYYFGFAPDVFEGIRYRDGVPVAYCVDGSNWYPAELVSHWYKKQFPNQRRGIPRASPSLDIFAQIRRINVACTTSYETVAKIAMVLQSKLLPPSVEAKAFEYIDIAMGQAMTLPGGYELGQVKAEHPSASHRDAVAGFIGEAARCFPMPLNKALGTSKDDNFASGSLDNIDYERALKCDRYSLNVHVSMRLCNLFLMMQGLEPMYLFVGYDPIAHLNEEKREAAKEKKLAMRLTSRTRLAAENGDDWEEIQAELEKEESLIGPQNVQSAETALPNAGGQFEGNANEATNEVPADPSERRATTDSNGAPMDSTRPD